MLSLCLLVLSCLILRVHEVFSRVFRTHHDQITSDFAGFHHGPEVFTEQHHLRSWSA